MKIEDKTIEYVAALAKLELSEEEGLTRERARGDLERILAYIETMNELDTEGIEPMSHVLPLKNVMREDVVREDMIQEDTIHVIREDVVHMTREDAVHMLRKDVAQKDVVRQAEQMEGRQIRREALLSNAPSQKEGCFVVPKTVE